jgi:hypothetical protein
MVRSLVLISLWVVASNGCGEPPAASDASVVDVRPTPAPPAPEEPSADVVPSWAGDYSMPPALIVRGLDAVLLSPWTWGWTGPPNENGEQESIVADGVPPDPPVVVEHDGVVDLVYPLAGWTFTAFAEIDQATRALTVSSGGDDTSRIDLSAVPNGTLIHVIGGASPGYYELNVSFASVTAQAAPSASDDPLITATPAAVRPGATFEVSFTGSLDEMRGGFFLLSDFSGRPVALLWSDKFEGEGPGFDLDVANAPVLDFGVIAPGPDTLVLPSDLDAGVYELCTENSRPTACTTIEVTR